MPFVGGDGLVVDTNDFSVWSRPFAWQDTYGEGWVAEVRTVLESTETGCGMLTLWMPLTAATWVPLHIRESAIVLGEQVILDMDATDAFHSYRLQHLGGERLQLAVDGMLVGESVSPVASRERPPFGLRMTFDCRDAQAVVQEIRFIVSNQPTAQPEADAGGGCAGAGGSVCMDGGE